MLSITKLKMWKDTGYSRECVEVPPAGSRKLPTPDYTADGLIRPHKDSTLQSLELPLKYSDVMDMSYLYVEFLDSSGPDDTGNTFSVFGWVLNIELVACSQDVVRIRWTPDYWRTYSSGMDLNRGIIRHIDPTTTIGRMIRRPYPVKPVMRNPDFAQVIGDSNRWVVVIHTKTENGHTTINYKFWQPDGTAIESAGHSYTPMSWKEIYSGLIEEYLQLDAKAIVGVFVVPFAPLNEDHRSINYLHDGGFTICRYCYSVSGATMTPDKYEVTFTGSEVLEADDINEIVVTDAQGNVAGRLPYGFAATGYYCYIDVGTASVSAVVIFKIRQNADLDVWGQMDSAQGVTGCSVTIPGIPIPVTENAYQSYNYSGQRSFEIEQKRLQREQAAISGYLGVGGSIAGGAISGAMVGGPVGGAVGAAAGASSSLIGTTANYYVSRAFDDQMQDATEQLYASQANNIALPGMGLGWLRGYLSGTSAGWYIIRMAADAGFQDAYYHEMNYKGIECYAPWEPSMTLPLNIFTYTGPLQITDAKVDGDIPPTAKSAIKTKLESGINIVEFHPTGTDPGA